MCSLIYEDTSLDSLEKEVFRHLPKSPHRIQQLNEKVICYKCEYQFLILEMTGAV